MGQSSCEVRAKVPQTLRLLRPIGRRGIFRIHRAMWGERPCLVWSAQHPDLNWRLEASRVESLLGRSFPGILSLRAIKGFRGEMRVIVDCPDTERWLPDWLKSNPRRSDRLEVIRSLSLSVSALQTAGISHGWLKGESFIVDSKGKAWLADFPATTIVGRAMEDLPQAPPLGLGGIQGDRSAEERDGRALGLLVMRLLTGGYPVAGNTPQNFPKSIPPLLVEPLRDLLSGKKEKVKSGLSRLSGRVEAVIEDEREDRGLGGELTRIVRRWLDPLSRLLLALAGGWAAIEVLRLLAFFPGSGRLPDLRGEPLHMALPRLRAMGYQVERVGEDEAGGFPMGVVSRTEPIAGRSLREGATIKIWTSPGPKENRLPDLVGEMVSEATRELLARGLWVGSIRVSQSALEVPGRVVGMVPEPGGILGHGEGVVLEVSFPLAEELHTFPSLHQKTVIDALTKLENEGIVVAGGVRIFRRTRQGLEKERVVGQSPQEGDFIPSLWVGDILLSVETPPETTEGWVFDRREFPDWIQRGGVNVLLSGGDEEISWREPWSSLLSEPAFLLSLRRLLNEGIRPVVLTITQGGRVAWSTRFE